MLAKSNHFFVCSSSSPFHVCSYYLPLMSDSYLTIIVLPTFPPIDKTYGQTGRGTRAMISEEGSVSAHWTSCTVIVLSLAM